DNVGALRATVGGRILETDRWALSLDTGGVSSGHSQLALGYERQLRDCQYNRRTERDWRSGLLQRFDHRPRKGDLSAWRRAVSRRASGFQRAQGVCKAGGCGLLHG